jgi:hypothetical protein
MKRKSHPEFRRLARTMRPRQDDEQTGSYLEIANGKRACGHEWSSSWLVAQPEAIRLGVTSVNFLLSHAPLSAQLGHRCSKAVVRPPRLSAILVAENGYLYPFVPAEDC